MDLGEVERALAAFQGARRAGAARDERLAWMTGYYCALAWHAPRRYPVRPGITFFPARQEDAMSEAAMKAALMEMARERRTQDDAGDAED